MPRAEDILISFKGGMARDEVPDTTQFRSTWLSSSLRALRDRQLTDRYLATLPREYHDAVMNAVVGIWLPARVALAHYEACDHLALPDNEIVAIGTEVGRHVHKTVLGVAVSLARGAGVTPWTILMRLPDLWDRIWLGGGVALYKLGPKEARLEIGGWPCARTTYTRVAMRGVISGLVELFAQKAYTRELTPLCSKRTLGYRIQWA